MSQNDGVLHRPAVVRLAAAHLPEPLRGVQGARRSIRLPHLEVDVADVPVLQHPENGFDERAAETFPPAPGRDREIQDLALIRRVERDDVATHLTGDLSNEKQRVGCDAVAEILRGPGIGEDLLLDRVDSWDIAESSGTNAEGGDRGDSPISLALPRDVHTPAPQYPRQSAFARHRTPKAQATIQRAARARRARQAPVRSTP